MLVDIHLQHFRSYTDASFEVDPGVNIIVGPNGSGKTNLLEAILVLARGGSYRAKDAELKQFAAEWARLDGDVENGYSRTLKLEESGGSLKKSFEIGNQVFQRLSHQKQLPVVLFEPDHLRLLAGSPEMRRNFLDDVIEQTDANFAATRRHYHRVLAQRNALLKQGLLSAKSQLFVWNLRLSELAGKIVQERLKLIGQINGLATETYQGLSASNTSVTVEYMSNCPPNNYESSLLQRLETHLERDTMLGFTSNGPHRDDLLIRLDGKPSSEVASRGETRTLILTLKMIEAQLLRNLRAQPPMLLLDDVFSELDGKRRQALTNFLQPYQTFLTTTDADVVVAHFTESCKIIPLSGG
jgi:DNA replication and repair protein RecF